jgi:hypothetical protein
MFKNLLASRLNLLGAILVSFSLVGVGFSPASPASAQTRHTVTYQGVCPTEMLANPGKSHSKAPVPGSVVEAKLCTYRMRTHLQTDTIVQVSHPQKLANLLNQNLKAVNPRKVLCTMQLDSYTSQVIFTMADKSSVILALGCPGLSSSSRYGFHSNKTAYKALNELLKQRPVVIMN